MPIAGLVAAAVGSTIHHLVAAVVAAAVLVLLPAAAVVVAEQKCPSKHPHHRCPDKLAVAVVAVAVCQDPGVFRERSTKR